LNVGCSEILLLDGLLDTDSVGKSACAPAVLFRFLQLSSSSLRCVNERPSGQHCGECHRQNQCRQLLSRQYYGGGTAFFYFLIEVLRNLDYGRHFLIVYIFLAACGR